MSLVEVWETESHPKGQKLWIVTRPGTPVTEAVKTFSGMVPFGGSVRSLQAAVKPEKYNLAEYQSIAAQSEKIEYTKEEITLGEAEDNRYLNGRIVSDDRWEYDEDDVLFIRHEWVVPKNLESL